MWELWVPFRSGKSGKVLVGRTLGGPEPQVVFQAGLGVRPAQVTPVLTPVSSEKIPSQGCTALMGKAFSLWTVGIVPVAESLVLFQSTLQGSGPSPEGRGNL